MSHLPFTPSPNNSGSRSRSYPRVRSLSLSPPLARTAAKPNRMEGRQPGRPRCPTDRPRRLLYRTFTPVCAFFRNVRAVLPTARFRLAKAAVNRDRCNVHILPLVSNSVVTDRKSVSLTYPRSSQLIVSYFFALFVAHRGFSFYQPLKEKTVIWPS